MNSKRSWLLIILQSGLLWSGTPILLSFLPAYMGALNFSASQIGVLMAVNPFIAIVFQPFLGVIVDKAKSKNMIYAMLMAGAVISALLLPINSYFIYVLLLVIVLSLFQVALIPISESITLEVIDEMKKSYAPVRMAGTIFYAVVALIVGYFMKRYLNSTFNVMAIIGVLNIMVVLRMPHISGHQNVGNKIPIRELFKDRMLVIYNGLAAVAQVLMTFFYTFMPILFLEYGGTEDALGWVFFISAMSEIPFLLKADKIIEKFGTKVLLVISMFVVGFRILLLAIVEAPMWFFFIGVLNGLAFIIFNYVLAVYINRTVRKELKTTGQTVLAVSMGVGRIIGASGGGFLLDLIGLNKTIMITSILCIATIVTFLKLTNRKMRT